VLPIVETLVGASKRERDVVRVRGRPVELRMQPLDRGRKLKMHKKADTHTDEKKRKGLPLPSLNTIFDHKQQFVEW
jgi:hypothetical protein